MDEKFSVLLVDDDDFALRVISNRLEEEGYTVKTANSGEKALTLMKETSFDLVITDLMMQGIDGIQVLKTAKDINPETMVIILTGYGDITSAIDAIRFQADDYLCKNSEPEELLFRISKCIEKAETSKNAKHYEKILTFCCVCKNVRDDIDKTPGSGEWISAEEFLWKKAKLSPFPTYCPECIQKILSDIDQNADTLDRE